MESGCTENGEKCPKLLDLIPQEREWHLKQKGEKHQASSSEERKLELRLGPPGDEDNWAIKAGSTAKNEPLISLGYLSSMKSGNNGKQPPPPPPKFPSTPQDHKHHHPVGSVLSPSWSKNHHQQLFHLQRMPVKATESSQPCCSKVIDIQNAEKKPFSPTANTAVPPPNTSQKRTAPGPVVGWPPIRSFRKNLTNSGSSSKPAPVLPHKAGNEKAAAEPSTKFVKINMDGVPIGRKIDLKAYDSYEKLSTAVDQLFRGLLAAQNHEEEKAIMGLSDGSGEYTLVYQDNEGDSMLVGDVPWQMFVSTVQRLRVLKSSELSGLGLGSNKQGKIPALTVSPKLKERGGFFSTKV